MDEYQPTLLEQQLKSYIQTKGPISTRAYIEACLYDPQHGYYRDGNPIGAEGDFITSPEISQMFGEMLSIWFVLTWQAMGHPVPLQLVELGPGRGTLMSDILRSLTKLHPQFEMISVHLIERSTSLRASQQTMLDKFPCPKHWHDQLSDVPFGPSIIIANEFLDCLPIRQFIKQPQAWHERVVMLDENKQFDFAVGPQLPPGLIIPKRFENAQTGSLFEYCPDLEGLVSSINKRASQHPLVALFIDYGYEGPALGETLQALQKHKTVSPFTAPGNVDLTAHVDFTALAAHCVAHGLKTYGPRDQGAFLSQLGIGARAQTLVKNANETQAEKLASDVVRLVAPEHMGSLFKTMCVTSNFIQAPPPFDQKIETSNAQT